MTENQENELGANFREWLEEFLRVNRLRKYQFARLIGVNPALIGHYLKGSRLPNYRTLQAIRKKTGANLNVLFED